MCLCVSEHGISFIIYNILYIIYIYIYISIYDISISTHIYIYTHIYKNGHLISFHGDF